MPEASFTVANKQRHKFSMLYHVVLDEFGPTIGQQGLLIYWALHRYADESHTCFPSLNTLAAKALVSRSTVKRFLPILVEVGLVVVHTRLSAKGDKDSNLYELIDVDEALAYARAHGKLKGVGSPGTHPQEVGSHGTEGGVRENLPGGVSQNLRGVSQTPEVEPLKNTQNEVDPLDQHTPLTPSGGAALKKSALRLSCFDVEPSSPAPQAAPTPLQEAAPAPQEMAAEPTPAQKQGFEQAKVTASLHREFEYDFWPAYPRHEGKQKAKEAFVRARLGTGPHEGKGPASLQELLDGIATWQASHQWQKSKEFIKWAQGWLNARMWEDTPIPAAATKTDRQMTRQEQFDKRVERYRRMGIGMNTAAGTGV